MMRRLCVNAGLLVKLTLQLGKVPRLLVSALGRTRKATQVSCPRQGITRSMDVRETGTFIC